jgi:flagellar biosynthesis repressor protein FlbT
MALKVELKPNERIIIGQVVIRNGEGRTRFFIEGSAPILREKDILTGQTADTPAKRIYLCVQLMYLDGFDSVQSDLYFDLINDFLGAAPSARSLCSEINNRILSGDFYKALKTSKELIAYEKKLVEHVSGDANLR